MTKITATGTVTLDDGSEYEVGVEGTLSENQQVEIVKIEVLKYDSLSLHWHIFYTYQDQLKAILQKEYDKSNLGEG